MDQSSTPLREVTWIAFKLGVTAFGGPAAHIAMLRQEVVSRRNWLSDNEFLDLLGITNLIPGPNSTEMVMHIGHVRAGRRGLVSAGVAFILPAAAITLVLAWLYVLFGTTAAGDWLLWGVKPVIIAVVGQALWSLGRTALKDPIAIAGTISVVAAYLAGVNELAIMFGGAFCVFVVRRANRMRTASFAFGIPYGTAHIASWAAQAASDTVAYGHLRLLWTFMKIGAVLYGSGYVLIAFLRNDFVVRYGWLTEQQLLDAVAAGQVTPGPVFTTATFAGFVMGGWVGAILATIGIFLPAFVFVGFTHPLARALRSRPLLAELLDAVNIAAFGLMGAAAIALTRDAVGDFGAALLAIAAVVALIRWNINATWLIALGALAGTARLLIG